MSPHNSKRKRVSEINVPPPAALPDKHVIFTRWAEHRGVVINGVTAAQLPDRGMGIVTTKRIKTGERLLFVPEKAMLKPDLEFLKEHDLTAASPQAQLAVSVLNQFGPPESSSSPWIDVLPTLDDFKQGMPVLWSDNERSMLPPPVLQPLERQQSDYARDVAATADFLANIGLEKHFRYYWLIVNSRSFHWKAPQQKGGVMVLCPFIDYLNHAPTGSSCNVTMTNKGYEVIANRNYDVGEEILATYGSHSNDKLLVHYGFICSYTKEKPSPDDDIRLDHVIIPLLSKEVRSCLQDVGFLGGYALIPATNELCFKTQVAIRATFLTANEWEYFMQNGEDLAHDHTHNVEKKVLDMCLSYYDEAQHLIEILGKAEQTPQNTLLIERWVQIASVILNFGAKIHAQGAEVEADTT